MTETAQNIWLLNADGSFRPRSLTPGTLISPVELISKGQPMPDLIWLAALGGLFLATLAYVRLCDEA